jgi:hypothetical protein
MLFQNLKAIGEEFSEISVLFCKYIYIFIYIDSIRWTQSRTPVILSVIHHRQNPSDLEKEWFKTEIDYPQIEKVRGTSYSLYADVFFFRIR